MTNMKADLTNEDRHKICKGELCFGEGCDSNNIELVGCASDGLNVNSQFRCTDCGAEWEGY